jgi:ABC-type uncharacterized transport system permease subunit
MRFRTARIVAATIKEQAQSEKAYLGNFWADLSSTGLFVITNVVFLDLLFRRAGEIAGYSKNDYFFMMLIGQLTFYSVSGFLANPMALLIDSVRNGYFDLILLKPVATRTYLYARAVKPLVLAMVSLPNIILFCILINWGDLNLNFLSVVAGAIVWVSGFIIFNTFIFALALPVFTQGDSTDMLNAYYSTMAMTQMPYNNLPTIMKYLSLVVLPAVLMTAGAVAVILMKGSTLFILISAIGAAFVSLILLSLMWKFALRNYASASS